jgi:hypothetical protein
VLHLIVEKSNDRKLSSIATAAVILVFAIAAHAQSPHGRGSWPWISLFSRSMRELPENLKAVASLYLENMPVKNIAVDWVSTKPTRGCGATAPNPRSSSASEIRHDSLTPTPRRRS